MLSTFAALFLLAQQAPPSPTNRSRPAPPPQVRPEDSGSLTGQVVSSTDGSPLRKATVTLRPTDSGRESPFITATDAGGRFNFEQVPPGRYDLVVERNGFVTWFNDSKRTGGSGQRLTLAKAERMTGVLARMIPQAVVTGRVLDEDGEPMARVHVQLKRAVYNQGKKQWTGWGGPSMTDDRGEYRIHGVVPGKYTIAASRQGGFREGGPPRPPSQSARDTRPDETYPVTYFPAGHEASQATLLDVQPGGTLSGIDFRLRRTPTVRVRGRVARPSESRRPAMVVLIARSAGNVTADAEPLRTMADSSGAFEVRGVMPGSYLLHVEDWDREAPLTGNLPVEVGRTNVDGLMVRLMPAVSLMGQFVYEDTPEAPAASPSVLLRSSVLQTGASGQRKPDGTFAMKFVKQGKYDVTVQGLPPGFYVKAVKAGEQNVLDAGLEVGDAPPAPLLVVLSPNGGSVEGTVSRDQKPVTGSTVVLWPTGTGAKLALHRYATTDGAGHFSLQGVPPGEYRLAAFGNLETGAWQDADFLKAYESKAERLSIQEKARESKMLVELTL